MSNTPDITLQNLCKTYVVPEREAGLGAALKSLVKRNTREIEAVKNISFTVAPGEIVGFLGPNGAGKTTTLKMLSGLLHPTSGDVSVLGYTPFDRKRDFLSQITLVMGQRNQLIWDIPVGDSFERNRAIYRLSHDAYSATRDELTDLLDLGDLLPKPVRNLSLGERMKCEIAAALLHRPQVLFLDEPTIGLDVTMQRRIRAFLGEYNRRYGATILLTSHYMADVEALCKRVIVIHHGQLLFDGALSALIQRFSAHKTIVVDLDTERADLSSYGDVVTAEGSRITLRVPKTETAQVTGRLLADLPVIDLTVEDPPIEEVIEQVFNLKSYLDIYRAFFKTTLATQFQYRVAMSIWMIGRVLEPIVYLVVWSTVAHARGGSVGGYSPTDFAAYYIVLMIVNQFTFTWIMHEYDYRVRQGLLSNLLLKPIHPIHSDIADNIAYKILMSVILFPTAALLYYLFDPNLVIHLQTLGLFLLSLTIAFLMRFFVEWTLAMFAFWTTRTDAINQMFFTLTLFLSGRIAPIDLLPDWVRLIANALPFRWAVAFPVELMLNRLNTEQIVTGFAAQSMWLLISFLLLKYIWRAGVKKYSAVGS